MTEIGFKSDKGIKRSNNEDACFVMPKENIYIVADGVGGNNGGEIASRTAVSHIAEYVRNNPPTDIVNQEVLLQEYLLACLSEINQVIYDLANKYPENAGMATTIVIAVLAEAHAYIMNIGDSRAYIYRNEKIRQITEDHTYINTLVKLGIITPEEARVHPKRNMITKALGGERDIAPDFFGLEIQEGDILLICTDGLHGELTDDTISAILSEGLSMPETCGKLITKANRSGGRDNITVVCLKI